MYLGCTRSLRCLLFTKSTPNLESCLISSLYLFSISFKSLSSPKSFLYSRYASTRTSISLSSRFLKSIGCSSLIYKGYTFPFSPVNVLVRLDLPSLESIENTSAISLESVAYIKVSSPELLEALEELNSVISGVVEGVP